MKKIWLLNPRNQKKAWAQQALPGHTGGAPEEGEQPSAFPKAEEARGRHRWEVLSERPLQKRTMCVLFLSAESPWKALGDGATQQWLLTQHTGVVQGSRSGVLLLIDTQTQSNLFGATDS